MQTTHATIEVPKQKEVQTVQPLIVVTGERAYKYSQFHWRQAIRQYLICIWTNHFSDQEIVDLAIPTNAPSLGCGDCRMTLRYHAIRARYEAFGMYDKTIPPSLRDVREGSVLEVIAADNKPERMESALARFAWNRQMRVLNVSLINCERKYMTGFWLWSYPGCLKVLERPRDS